MEYPKHVQHKQGNTTFLEINSNYNIKNIITILFPIGANFDSKKSGLSHVVEHMVFDSQDTEKFVEKELMGIYTNAYTTYESTEYTAESLDTDASKLMKYLLESMRFKFTNKDLEKQIGVISSEIAEKKDRDVHEQIYAKNFNLSIKGSKSSIKSISLENVDNFIKNYYKNPKIVISTNKKLSKTDIEKIFSLLNEKFIFDSKEVEYPNILAKKAEMEFENDGTNVICFTQKHKDRNRLNLFLPILRDYMANNWSSILSQELRVKKNLLYSIYAESNILKDHLVLYIYFDCDKKNLKEIRNYIKKTLNDIAKGTVNEDVFKCSKALLKLTVYNLYKDEAGYVNDFLWTNMFGDEDWDNKKYIEELNKITLQDFITFCKKIIK